MPRQEIELGTAPLGEGGDNARTAFERINAMTSELYQGVDALAGSAESTSEQLAAAEENIDNLQSSREFRLVPGENINIDRSDPDNPVISAVVDGGSVDTVAGVAPVGGDIPVAPLAAALGMDSKVDKVDGKGLSANDFTDALYQKLSGLEGSKFQGLFVSLEALQVAVPAGEPGWYAHIDPGTGGEATAVAIWDVDDAQWFIMQGGGGEMTPSQVKSALLANPDTNVLTDDEYALIATIADKVEKEAGKGLSSNDFTTALLNKLNAIQAGATANATDAQLRDRSTHTGTQLAATISDLASAVRATLLTGLVSGSNEAIAATDSIIQALGKLQAQIDESGGGSSTEELGKTEFYFGKRATLSTARPGRAPIDGQLLSRTANADLWAFVQANYTVVTDANWLNASLGLYGNFSSGDGSTTFRLPDWNGAVSGHKRRVPRGTSGDGGGLTEDALQGHGHRMYIANGLRGTQTTNGSVDVVSAAASVNTLDDRVREVISDGISGAVRVADETRAASVDGVWLIRIASGGSNPGTVDVTALNSEQVAQGVLLSQLDDNLDFTFIYPNGGSAASPANVSINSRYVSSNPFPGHSVICEAQIQRNGVWGNTGWWGIATGGSGVRASQLGDDIIVQTGLLYLDSTSSYTGSSFGQSGNYTTPSPCRVRVWKIKGGVV